jgi:hypothetical protein
MCSPTARRTTPAPPEPRSQGVTSASLHPPLQLAGFEAGRARCNRPARRRTPLSTEASAGLPVARETATRSIDQLGVKSGSTLFINGASGGIGSTAVQLAAARGARVIGPGAVEPVVGDEPGDGLAGHLAGPLPEGAVQGGRFDHCA